MIRLTEKQIICMHSSLIAATGGLDGVRDNGLLESALETPFQTFDGKDIYPSLLQSLSGVIFYFCSNLAQSFLSTFFSIREMYEHEILTFDVIVHIFVYFDE